MENKRKIKLIAYLTATSIVLHGCKMTMNNIFNKDKVDKPKDDFTTSQVGEETEYTNKETIGVTIPMTTEPTAQQQIETKPIIIETEPMEEQTELSNQIIVKATTNVNIRSGNSVDSLIIGQLNENDIAYKLLSCDNNWDLVKISNMIGYVCRDYLEYTEKTYELEYKYKEKKDIVITKTELNFRIEPNTEHSRISKFSKNTELEVIAEIDNGWLLVRNNGVIGYVHGDYVISLLELAKLEYPDLNLEKIDVQKVIYTTASSLNIRTGSGIEYESIGKLEKYESARVLGEYDGWYFVMTNEYKFGFISKKYTKDMENNYVVVDKSEQRLYLYNDNELLLVTPVTTGKDTTPSDTGLFQVWDRTNGRYLSGADYHVWVDYWVAYNGGEGLHDAAWRSVFGTEGYHTGGSHGCINIPPDLADDVYYNTSYETKVLVHK